MVVIGLALFVPEGCLNGRAGQTHLPEQINHKLADGSDSQTGTEVSVKVNLT